MIIGNKINFYETRSSRFASVKRPNRFCCPTNEMKREKKKL